MKQEQRLSPRQPFDASVRIAFHHPQHGLAEARATCLDVSQRGMQVKLDQPLEKSTLVKVFAAKLGITDVATVRHCRRAGFHFRAGLEFSSGFHWMHGR
ncbi:MAG: PilZ domain-containing protein [Bryobacteraceae bacterium]|nr:PilZ domain-containing protein [Bryobacteraceae bacterium]